MSLNQPSDQCVMIKNENKYIAVVLNDIQALSPFALQALPEALKAKKAKATKLAQLPDIASFCYPFKHDNRPASL